MEANINIDFIRDFKTKEEVQDYVNELKDELKEMRERLASIYFNTEPEKICPKNQDVFEWMHDEFDRALEGIYHLAVYIDECEKLLEQWCLAVQSADVTHRFEFDVKTVPLKASPEDSNTGVFGSGPQPNVYTAPSMTDVQTNTYQMAPETDTHGFEKNLGMICD